jgi:hypothetical protein
VTRVGFLALVVLLAVSCGAQHAKLAKLEPSRACLRAAGVRTDQQLGADFIAGTATGGAFRAHFGKNFVTVVFSDTVDHADGINDAYHRFHAQNVGIEDVLRQQGNVVMLWHEHPTDAAQSTVVGCLE